ncbi:DUF6463 family protein [Streptomyces roseoviridis]|uniref:DUF6463 family protein n=1 Tax=Streptomyces roseoviridis TaxID=67361 RepID=A0ABV5QXJ6_9ACTN
MAKWIPRLVMALAAAHFAVFVLASTTFDDMAREGLWNTAPGEPRRAYELWFLLAGFGLLALGTLSRRLVRDTGRLPAQLGWYLLAIGVPLLVLYPVSGAPGLVLVGVLALLTSRQQAKAAGPARDPRGR